MVNKRKSGTPIRYIALVGVLAATLECAKLALSFLPNIEVVTLLTALYSYVFGIWGVAAAFVFVSIEPIIYGFGTWVVSYYLYWPLVAFVFMLLGRAKLRNRVVITATAVILTVFFGVLTSLIDTGLLSAYFDNFFYRFSILYMRGIPFFVTQIVCNAVLFPLLFRLLSDKLYKLKEKML